MNVRCHSEVHFDRSGRYMIEFRDTSDPDDRQFGQLLFVSSIALRQLVNLGPKNPNTVSVLGYMGLAATQGFFMKQAVDDLAPREVGPVTGPQKKRFVSDLIYSDSTYSFTQDAKGFGLLARNIQFYAARQILAVANWVSKEHPKDVAFGFQLDMVLANAAGLFDTGTITVFNQQDAALFVTQQAVNQPVGQYPWKSES